MEIISTETRNLKINMFRFMFEYPSNTIWWLVVDHQSTCLLTVISIKFCRIVLIGFYSTSPYFYINENVLSTHLSRVGRKSIARFLYLLVPVSTFFSTSPYWLQKPNCKTAPRAVCLISRTIFNLHEINKKTKLSSKPV